ncbi:MAG: hypothetical protein WAL32_04180 [Terriglobales bacterium]
MADELKHESPETGFERQDLSPRGVYTFLMGLGVGVALVAIVLWGLYHAMDAYIRTHQPRQSPLVTQSRSDTRVVSPNEINAFPQPRLEQNERLEINAFRLHEEQVLDSYGWVDKPAGVVRIPIERAMQLIAQRGLPTTPKAGTIPPSEVNVVNQAAQRSDTSNLNTKGQKQK